MPVILMPVRKAAGKSTDSTTSNIHSIELRLLALGFLAAGDKARWPAKRRPREPSVWFC